MDRLCIAFVASSPPNNLFYSSLKYIPSQASTRSWPGVDASYRTPRTIAGPLTMASLAMASGFVLYSSACESTGYRVQDVSEILHQPSSIEPIFPEIQVKFLLVKRLFFETLVRFFETFETECFDSNIIELVFIQSGNFNRN